MVKLLRGIVVCALAATMVLGSGGTASASEICTGVRAGPIDTGEVCVPLDPVETVLDVVVGAVEIVQDVLERTCIPPLTC